MGQGGAQRQDRRTGRRYCDPRIVSVLWSHGEVQDQETLDIVGEKAEVLLAHIFSLAGKQAHGEKGVLSAKHANVFHVRGTDMQLHPVTLCWSEQRDRWYIYACGYGHAGGWRVGDQIFYRIHRYQGFEK